jgi:hypothetical protein
LLHANAKTQMKTWGTNASNRNGMFFHFTKAGCELIVNHSPAAPETTTQSLCLCRK